MDRATFLAGAEEPKDLKSMSIPGQSPLELDAAAAIADKIFSDGKLHWIFLPQGQEGVYVVGKQADDEPNRWSTNRSVTVDQYRGTSFTCRTGQNSPRASGFSNGNIRSIAARPSATSAAC
jgi:uncharacterized iron-regulated membrane protein